MAALGKIEQQSSTPIFTLEKRLPKPLTEIFPSINEALLKLVLLSFPITLVSSCILVAANWEKVKAAFSQP